MKNENYKSLIDIYVNGLSICYLIKYLTLNKPVELVVRSNSWVNAMTLSAEDSAGPTLSPAAPVSGP